MRKLLGARYELSLLLIAGSIVLLVAIVLGNSMGNRVLGMITSRAAVSTTPVPIPTPSAGDASNADIISKRHEVLSVATDPGFPDPRITPEPPPPATPRPTPRPTATPTFDDGDPSPEASDIDRYTSPPLLLPIASHAPEDSSPVPEESDSPRASETAAPRPAAARGYPSLPPAAPPT